ARRIAEVKVDAEGLERRRNRFQAIGSAQAQYSPPRPAGRASSNRRTRFGGPDKHQVIAWNCATHAPASHGADASLWARRPEAIAKSCRSIQSEFPKSPSAATGAAS